MTDSYGYTVFGEVKDYTASVSGVGVYSSSFTYDKMGRISTKTETVNGETHTYQYGYDAIGQLTDVWVDGSLKSHYDYDSNGNRVGGTYDDQDRMIKYGENTYQYSANGELQQKVTPTGTTKYAYDVLGNLTAVTLEDGTKIEYVIDGANRRVGKKVNGVLVQGWLYQDGLKPVAELDGNGNVVSRFVYGTNGMIPDYMVKNGVEYRIISDHLGSVRMVVDVNTGQVVQQIDYDEWGNVTRNTQEGFQPFAFAGGLYDENTKITRFGVRDFDPITGRWTCQDPIGFAGGSSNLFEYSINDPINRFDPTGTQWIEIAQAAQKVFTAPPIQWILFQIGSGFSQAWSKAGELIVNAAQGARDAFTGNNGSTDGGGSCSNDPNKFQPDKIKTLQTGGNTLSNRTLKELGLTPSQGKTAIEALKRDLGLPNNFHQKIMSNGDVVNSATGKVEGNLFEYLP